MSLDGTYAPHVQFVSRADQTVFLAINWFRLNEAAPGQEAVTPMQAQRQKLGN
jgi:hypothetical protein